MTSSVPRSEVLIIEPPDLGGHAAREAGKKKTKLSGQKRDQFEVDNVLKLRKSQKRRLRRKKEKEWLAQNQVLKEDAMGSGAFERTAKGKLRCTWCEKLIQCESAYYAHCESSKHQKNAKWYAHIDAVAKGDKRSPPSRANTGFCSRFLQYISDLVR